MSDFIYKISRFKNMQVLPLDEPIPSYVRKCVFTCQLINEHQIHKEEAIQINIMKC